MSLYAIGRINGDPDVVRDAANRFGLTDQDALICLGDTLIGTGGECGHLLDELCALPCDVAILRGAADILFWESLQAGTYGTTPRFVNWWDGWCMTEGGHDNLYYLPDAGGVFYIGGIRCAMIPTTIPVDDDMRLYGHPAMRLRSLLMDPEQPPMDAVFSYSMPTPGSRNLDAAFLASLRAYPSLRYVPWFYSNPSAQVPGATYLFAIDGIAKIAAF
jgi:hypothetical protein